MILPQLPLKLNCAHLELPELPEIYLAQQLEINSFSTTGLEAEPKSKPPLGERLQKIREEIVASGVPLLDWEGVEREKALW